jgi:hypothetical protein
MTKLINLRRFRLLAVGGAKARTNDGSGNQTPEDAFLKYSS